MNLYEKTLDATDELDGIIFQLRDDDRISAAEQDMFGDEILALRQNIIETIQRHNDV